jgi:D-3-phosphoglycerate dehydrogenase
MRQDKPKVVITDTEFGSVEIERQVLAEIGAEPIVLNTMDEDIIAKETADADAVITEYAKITPRIISGLRKCKVIARYGIGVDMIDLEAASRAGIPVANAPDYGIEEVATHTIAVFLTLARKTAVYDRALKDGKWGYKIGFPIYRLQGQTLGLIGFGNIARTVASMVSGLGLKVLAHDPFIGEDEMAKRNVVKAETVEEILRQADFVSLHIPLMESTRGMIGEKELAMMKPSAYLINTGRGGLINEESLVKALKKGRISGAGLDVFQQEPIREDSPLLKLENVLVTPHCAFYSEESLKNLQRMPAEEVVRVLKGGLPRSFVNRDLLAKYRKIQNV